MSFGEAITSVRSNLTNFTGRARRSEFWWWYLAVGLVGVAVGIVSTVIMAIMVAIDVTALTAVVGIVLGLALLALFIYVFIGTLSVGVRRLHDTDRSGLFYLLSFVPVGNIVLIVFWVLDPTPGPNQYGPNPQYAAAQQVPQVPQL